MPVMNLQQEIDDLTQNGHKSLAEGRITEACSLFERAASLSSDLRESFTERACYFNLGACYVAQGDAKRGVEYLKKAQPPDKDADGSANFADLHYNLGLAYDVLGELKLAIECYETALQDYKNQNNQELQAETLSKLAIDCSENKELSRSASYYGDAGEIYGRLGDKTNQVFALTNRATILGEIRDIENCAETLRSVIEICEGLTDQVLQGKVYNDLGLLYNRLKSYNNAAECFEIALPLITGLEQEKHLEAVLRQNLGAVYNQIKMYDKALKQHEIAIKLHSELGNKSAEGQTACNMGFAYSQLQKFDQAISRFHLAIKTSKDTNDICSHWQANEGLAAVYFLKQNYKKAVEHYKIALSSLTSSGAVTTAHNERIVNKLADAMKFLYSQQDSTTLTEKKGKRRISSKHKHRKPEDETDEGSQLIGKTRERSNTNHRLIARGIDGYLDDELDGSSNFNGSSEDSTDSDDSSIDHKERYTRNPKTKNNADKTLKVGSNNQLILSGPYQKLIKENRRKSSDHSDVTNEGYEKPEDENEDNISYTDHSPEMPRAHREAYLASIAAATSTPKKTAPSPEAYESSVTKESNQSRMCVVQ